MTSRRPPSRFLPVFALSAAVILATITGLPQGNGALAQTIRPQAIVTDTRSTPGTTTFTVPANVTSVTFEVSGAAGGSSAGGATGGLGGRSTGTISVSAGDQFSIVVGGSGGNGSGTTAGTGGSN